jgi:3-deoxy-D-manno-octulosonic-acid transferase
MQSEVDAQRIVALGGRDDAAEVLGSPKSEYQPPPASALAATAGLLKEWNGFLIVVCGSTRPGEERILLNGYRQLLSQRADVKMILAPRHLKRLGEVSRLLEESGCRFTTRRGQPPTVDTDILLVDTIGELNCLYHFADVAFVGGTLAPLGGHNLLEPALAGCPVLYGPHFFAQQPAAELLDKFHLGFVIETAAQFSERVLTLPAAGSPRDRFASQVEQLRHANASIVDSYVDRILR